MPWPKAGNYIENFSFLNLDLRYQIEMFYVTSGCSLDWCEGGLRHDERLATQVQRNWADANLWLVPPFFCSKDGDTVYFSSLLKKRMCLMQYNPFDVFCLFSISTKVQWYNSCWLSQAFHRRFKLSQWNIQRVNMFQLVKLQYRHTGTLNHGWATWPVMDVQRPNQIYQQLPATDCRYCLFPVS